MFRRIKSINTVISIILTVLLLAGIGAMVAGVSASVYSSTFDIQTGGMRESARALLSETDEYIDSCLAVVRTLAQQEQVRELLSGNQALHGTVKDQLGASLKARPNLNSVFLIDASGKTVAGQTAQGGSMDETDLSGRPYWTEVLQGRESLGRQISKGASTGVLVFTVVVPVKDANGRVIGGAGLAVNWSRFMERYILPVKIGSQGYAYILDDKGAIIAHPDQASVLRDVSDLGFVRDTLARKNGVMRYEYKGVEKVQAFAQVERTGWIVCVNATEEDLAAPAVRLRNALILGGFTGFAALLVLILLLMRRLVIRPLQNVQAFTGRIAQGDYAATLQGSFRYELGDLARDITRMTGELKDKLSFSQGVLQGIASPFFIGDKDCKLAYANKPLLDLMDRPGDAESYRGRNLAEFLFGDPNRDTITARTLRENKVFNDVDADLVLHNGKKLHVRVDSAPLYDLDRQVSGVITSLMDVTSLKDQQERIARQNERITEAAHTSQTVSGAMTQSTEGLAAQIEQSSKGARLQSARMAETAAAMQQMNATVLEVARNASQASETSGRARGQAEAGAKVVGRVIEFIAQVKLNAHQSREDMGMLGDRAQGIGQVLDVISDIADQTNLLALNAAIEAARAGEAGRGFAVVADEVRKLAEKTMTATRDVGEAIRSIQEGARKNRDNVELAVNASEQATALAGQSGEALAEIVRLVELAADQVRSIATASEEQSAASEEIHRSVEEVNRISEETAASMDEAAQSVRDLAGQARSLLEMIASMQGGEPDARKALAAGTPRSLGR
ncbi:Methyl-accepting chemotaxis protein McpQ [Fundidesulfovibrio magnetotacticus]|uniref:Methyl-accepting chemotaxis protein McpQ n=1 Tax=Fundidesulfovibrio magnetotacticus TaxID=2730080 RepID=A0A6V8LP31_9BACT|nr:methyl-accepting chemotaxis protein [Fundidesulfovibrio magnetotacticus]GFK92750.1 Methyl-accepting chemotaxis protein McpQ [Fundidesulfovibrio magnetotacticus]